MKGILIGLIFVIIVLIFLSIGSLYMGKILGEKQPSNVVSDKSNILVDDSNIDKEILSEDKINNEEIEENQEEEVEIIEKVVEDNDVLRINSGKKVSTELPNLLASYEFYNGESVLVKSTETFGINFEVENNKINVGTDYNNPLYEYELIFSKTVNFSNMYISSADPVQFFRELYKIQEGSSNNKIVLKREGTDREIILEDQQPAKINGESIQGVYVDIMGTGDYVNRINIKMAMQDSNKDYIEIGEYFDDPVFNQARLTFESYNETEEKEVNKAEVYIERIRS